MAVDETQEDAVQLIGFYAGRKLYGADILSVREILRDPDIEPAEDAPDAVTGMVRLRGAQIPVMDLQSRLGGESPLEEQSQWALITRVDDIMLGFIVGKVTRIYKMSPGAIMPAPEIILSGLSGHYIRGVCESESGTLVVLDLKRIPASKDIEDLKRAVQP